MIAQLHEVPAAPLAGIAPADLTVEAFGDIKAASAKLAGAWRPAAQGRSFVWRGVTETGALGPRLHQAASSLATLRGHRPDEPDAGRHGRVEPPIGRGSTRPAARPSVGPAGGPAGGLADDRQPRSVSAAVTELADQLAQIAARERQRQPAAEVRAWSPSRVQRRCPILDDQALGSLVPPPSRSAA